MGVFISGNFIIFYSALNFKHTIMDIEKMYLGELFEYRSILISKRGDDIETKKLIDRITFLIHNFCCMM